MTSPLLLLTFLVSAAVVAVSAKRPSSSSMSPWGVPLQWQPVDPDFSWNQRQTGISKKWTAGLAVWSHFDASALENASRIHPKPWTTGLMCKFLRLVDETTFELYSVYERPALGRWLQGEGFLGQSRRDKLVDQGYTFAKTPFRITQLPVRIWNAMDRMSQAAACTRATIVEPHAATFSGPRWLPRCEQAQRLVQQNAAATATAMKNARFHFCEMWLAETTSDGKPEGRKMGLFVQYDGITGELQQVFRIREVQLPNAPRGNPKRRRLDLHRMERQLKRTSDAWSCEKHLETDVAVALKRGDDLSQVLQIAGNYTCFYGRAVQVPGAIDGPEVACSFQTTTDPPKYYSPAIGQSNLYYSCRFEDGAYARIPKSFSPESIGDKTWVGMEFGCVTQSGDFHRLLAVGSREQGGLHTTVYERWCHALPQKDASSTATNDLKRAGVVKKPSDLIRFSRRILYPLAVSFLAMYTLSEFRVVEMPSWSQICNYTCEQSESVED